MFAIEACRNDLFWTGDVQISNSTLYTFLLSYHDQIAGQTIWCFPYNSSYSGLYVVKYTDPVSRPFPLLSFQYILSILINCTSTNRSILKALINCTHYKLNAFFFLQESSGHLLWKFPHFNSFTARVLSTDLN